MRNNENNNKSYNQFWNEVRQSRTDTFFKTANKSIVPKGGAKNTILGILLFIVMVLAVLAIMVIDWETLFKEGLKKPEKTYDGTYFNGAVEDDVISVTIDYSEYSGIYQERVLGPVLDTNDEFSSPMDYEQKKSGDTADVFELILDKDAIEADTLYIRRPLIYIEVLSDVKLEIKEGAEVKDEDGNVLLKVSELEVEEAQGGYYAVKMKVISPEGNFPSKCTLVEGSKRTSKKGDTHFDSDTETGGAKNAVSSFNTRIYLSEGEDIDKVLANTYLECGRVMKQITAKDAVITADADIPVVIVD